MTSSTSVPDIQAMAGEARTIIVLPAFNAAATLASLIDNIPRDAADELLLVDDGSSDGTIDVARNLRLTVVVHDENRGYGGAQKTCYREALRRGSDFIVMLHPDHQYDPRIIPAALDVLRLGICDVVLGNRIRTRREALDGGMPIGKYLANRTLTLLLNFVTGQNLGEWHSGFRAYQRRVLQEIRWEENSDDFVFDAQFLLQCVQAGFRLGDVPMPVRYFPEASSIGWMAAVRYAVGTIGCLLEWFLHRAGILRRTRFIGRDVTCIEAER